MVNALFINIESIHGAFLVPVLNSCPVYSQNRDNAGSVWR
jgi:hypothetical protein